MMQRLIPKIFYERLADAIDFFVDGLGFAELHRDEAFAVVGRDGCKAYLVEDPAFAAKDRPELAIETDTIEALHAEIRTRRADLLHPNGRTVAKKPWGALEFAVRDRTEVCVVFRQWPLEDRQI